MIEMNKKHLLAAALAALLIGGSAGAAEAGGKRHFGLKFHGPSYSYGHYGYGYRHGCWWLKKKYFKTGHYHWLRKFKRCKYGYY